MAVYQEESAIIIADDTDTLTGLKIKLGIIRWVGGATGDSCIIQAVDENDDTVEIFRSVAQVDNWVDMALYYEWRYADIEITTLGGGRVYFHQVR